MHAARASFAPKFRVQVTRCDRRFHVEVHARTRWRSVQSLPTRDNGEDGRRVPVPLLPVPGRQALVHTQAKRMRRRATERHGSCQMQQLRCAQGQTTAANAATAIKAQCVTAAASAATGPAWCAAAAAAASYVQSRSLHRRCLRYRRCLLFLGCRRCCARYIRHHCALCPPVRRTHFCFRHVSTGYRHRRCLQFRGCLRCCGRS